MDKETVIKIGKRVKQIREALGMAQKEFAHSIKIAASYVSQIEKGKKDNPGVAVFLKIALRHNVSLDYLLRGTGSMFLNPSFKHHGLHREYVEKIETVDDLLWFLEHSTFFRNIIMGMAFKLHYENEDLIKRSLMEKKSQENYDYIKESEHEISNKRSEKKENSKGPPG